MIRNSKLYAGAWLRMETDVRGGIGTYVRKNFPYSRRDEANNPALVENNAHVFERNVRTVLEHVRSRGGRTLLLTMPWSHDPGVHDQFEPIHLEVMREHNEILRALAAEERCLLVDLELWAESDPAGSAALFSSFCHMTPEGQALKAGRVAEALMEAGLFP